MRAEMLMPAASRSFTRAACLGAAPPLGAGCGSGGEDAPAGAIPGPAQPAVAIGEVSIARTFRGGKAWRTTAFYDARDHQTQVHRGGYAAHGVLGADIQRYAVDGRRA